MRRYLALAVTLSMAAATLAAHSWALDRVDDVVNGTVVGSSRAASSAAVPSPAQDLDRDHAARRGAMVDTQIAARGLKDSRVAAAMRKVPRDRFVPPELGARAYDDRPLPIGYGQTISQPYIVAYMTEALGIAPHHKVLEIGTGSGYQAAVLGELARTVYTVEIVPELARRAASTLTSLGYRNVQVREGDGFAGWPEHAPFDRIMVTAAPEDIPKPLLEQLGPRGRLVIPVGAQGSTQWLTIVDKTGRELTHRRTLPVAFVPLTRN